MTRYTYRVEDVLQKNGVDWDWRFSRESARSWCAQMEAQHG